jgi:uncharacterized protein (DUF3820 family)
MDASTVALVENEIATLQTLLEATGDRPALEIGRLACKEILNLCRRPKRLREDVQEYSDKAELVELSRQAGLTVLPFGKHEGKQLDKVPKAYLCWLLGHKRKGREFVPIPVDAQSWIRSRHADTLSQVQAYLTWRCWACGSQEVRFKNARLCTACWCE